MVVFNCNRCSRRLKKKEVEKHSYQCGGPSKISVTCADCLKDFIGNEYDKHTSCVTEEVRYGGKGVVFKETGKKQNQWLGIVARLLNSENALEPDVRKFLNSIRNYENIPRNQKKFQNFAKSSVRCMDVNLVDKTFNALYAEFQKTNSSPIKAECNKQTNGNSSSISPDRTEDKVDVDVETVQKKETEKEDIGKFSKKKRKLKKKKKFDWFDTIVQVVKSKGGEISVKRLTKKIINEYIYLHGDLGIHENLEAKMKKKLKTCPQVKVLKDKVTLLSE